AVHRSIVNSARRTHPPQLTVVVGESGRGKSATAAAWLRAWARRGRRPERLVLDGSARAVQALDDLHASLTGRAGAGGAPAEEAGGGAVVLDDLHTVSTREVEPVIEIVRALGALGAPVLLTGRPAPSDAAWSRV